MSRTFVEEAKYFLQSQFPFQLEQSTLKLFSERDWHSVCTTNGFEKSADGLYLPHTFTACVRSNSPTLPLETFHELFGHGLFFEHSQCLHSNAFGVFSDFSANAEGFAMWIEKLLAKQLGYTRLWEKKEKNLFEFYARALAGCEEFIGQFSQYEFLAQMGFPKTHEPYNLEQTIRNMYGSHFQSVQAIILYGSKKPTNDIDLLVVSDLQTHNTVNAWLDIYNVHHEEFFHKVRNYDISVLDPLFTGTQIYGLPFNDLKKEVVQAPVTEKNILYHENEIKRLENFSPQNTREHNYCASYLDSFRKNLCALHQGNKFYSYADLMSF